MKLPKSQIFFASLVLAALPSALAAQTTTVPPNVPAAAAQNTQVPSAVLTPAVNEVRQALAGLRPDKWKTPGPVTQETAQNIASIQRDLDSTLPGLLTAADRNPGAVQDVLPAYRNVDALYDVLLRVTEVSKLAAPAQQSGPLQQATASLSDARRTLGDQLQNTALNETRAIVSLQGQLRTAQSASPQTVSAAAPVCPAPAPAAKKRTTPKPKPAAATSTPPPTATH